MGNDIVITYKTLFELLRLEKTRDALQKLETSFYSDVVDYINDQKANLRNSSEEDVLKMENQLRNTHRIMSELYSRRERKISEMALNKAKLGSGLIDTSSLLPEEEALFNELVSFFGSYRNNLLFPLLQGKMPSLSTEKQESEEREQNDDENGEGTGEQEEENTPVRFLHPVPKFVGKELEIYGPFEEDDIANLPREIAKLLIEKGRAEEMNSK